MYRQWRAWLLAAVSLLAGLPAASATVATVPLYLMSGHLDPYAARASRNIAYYGPVQVGTPAQTFAMCFDTGSANFWLHSSQCPDESCLVHKTYSPLQSSTAKAGLANFSIQYGTGAVIGYLDSDLVMIGAPNITIQQQDFGEAYRVSNDFVDTSCDGLLGLGFPNISTDGTTPPFFNMISQNLLTQNRFSLWLNPNQSAMAAGELVFGGVNPAYYTGQLRTVPLSKQGFWQIPLSAVGLGGSAVPISSNQAILDSGTTGIVMSQQDATAINGRVPQLTYDTTSDLYTIPCDQAYLLPNITFVIGSFPYDVPGEEWTAPMDDAGVCVSVILGSPYSTVGTPIVLGDNFLREWFTVYNYSPSGSSVSIARAAILNNYTK